MRQFLITFPFVLIAVYLMGKRAIGALYLVLLSQRLWDLNLLQKARMPIYGVIALVFFALFATGYQTVVRNISSSTLSRDLYYENQRLDYGRDHTLRAAIFAELHQEPILSYRGQATIFDLTFAVPRSVWPEKPFPYGNYMTSYALGIPPQLNGWTFTTSIFDEAIANYGWLGMLTAPLFMGLLCRLADGNNTILFRSLGYIVCLMFMAVQLSAFMGLFLIWLGGSLWHQYRAVFSLRPGRLREVA